MTSTGASFACGAGTCHYGAGWFVNLAKGDGNWWHGGSMPGATAMLVRTYNNVVWIGLFNGRTVSPINSESELDATLWKAINGVTSFPTHDLFPTFR
jgi:N-acyl-D-amino-acid deacylase